jgi:hypothetical protein
MTRSLQITLPGYCGGSLTEKEISLDIVAKSTVTVCTDWMPSDDLAERGLAR